MFDVDQPSRERGLAPASDADEHGKVLDLVNFLEWLDFTRRLSYADDDETHEVTARRYLAGDQQRYGDAAG